MFEEIKKTTATIFKRGYYPDFYRIDTCSTAPEVVINNRTVLVFCSNNYLGIANDQRVQEAVISAAKKYGMGSGGSRLVTGNTNIQEVLESKIANFKSSDAAIVFTTGYMANVGVLPAIMKVPLFSTMEKLFNFSMKSKNKAIFSDELNHASLVDGIRLAQADKFVYKHSDLNDLEDKLKQGSTYSKKLIVTDGVFSMDGDIAPLPGIISLAKKYGAQIYLDDAHATGVLGTHGNGSTEHFGILDFPGITMGTFTKTFGGIGGYVTSDRKLIEYLRIFARTYMFSAPIPPAIVAGIIAAIDIVVSEGDKRRIALKKNTNNLVNKLEERGFRLLNKETQIIPVHIGSESKAIMAARELLKQDILVPAIRWPAVPYNKSRLRLTLMSTHTHDHINKLVDALVSVRNKINF